MSVNEGSRGNQSAKVSNSGSALEQCPQLSERFVRPKTEIEAGEEPNIVPIVLPRDPIGVDCSTLPYLDRTEARFDLRQFLAVLNKAKTFDEAFGNVAKQVVRSRPVVRIERKISLSPARFGSKPKLLCGFGSLSSNRWIEADRFGHAAPFTALSSFVQAAI